MTRNARHHRLPTSGVLALALIAFVAGAPRAARANGAFPDEFSVHFQPGAPSRILVGANFGLLVSEDNGATWRYSCEPWIVAGSSASVNPEASVSFYQVTADGVLLAQAVNVTRSADQACTWPAATGLEGQVLTDIFASPSDPTLVMTIVATAFGSYLVPSHDGGKSFDATPLYDTRPPGSADLLTGVEIARTDPAVIYVTTVRTSGGGAKLLQSTDSGAHWTPHDILADPGTQPRILGVDPVDKNTVYLRLLTGISDAIWITSDGGQTFQKPLTINGQFTSFLRASDGTVYLGTAGGQLYVQPPGATTFNPPRPAPHLRCLGQRFGEPKRIYACGDFVIDGWSLYSTDDGGQTFTPVMKFTDLQGPLGCGSVTTNCAAHWERIKGVLGIGTPFDAGQGGGGTPPPPSGGSHCSSLGADAAALLVLLTFWLRRRRS